MNPTYSKPGFYRKLNLVFTGLLSLILSYSGLGQNIERVFSEGFHNQEENLDRFSNGSWLISNVSSRIPGSFSNENIYVTILDSTATLIDQIKISHLADEDFKNESSLVFPDGGFLVMYSVRNCDAGIHGYYIEKFDPAMQSVWHIQLDEFTERPFVAVSPDENILLLLDGDVRKISSVDASILWESSYALSGQPRMVILEPGTENFITASIGQIGFYNQEIDNGDIEYHSGISNNYDDQMRDPDKFWAGSDSIFYILTKGTEKLLLRFRRNLEFDTLVTLPLEFIDVTATNERIAVLKNRNYLQYEILLYDTSGLLLDTYVSAPSALRPVIIYADEDGIGIAGAYGSGPFTEIDTTYLYTSKAQGWFRYFPEYTFIDSEAEVSVAITAIVQQDTIAIESFWDEQFQRYLLNFEGGNFKMEITNTGHEVVNSFWINIAFGIPVNFSFCNSLEGNYLLVEDVAIQPGESYWYDFGHISSSRQSGYPEEFCFWTSGPNFLPDFLPGDDVYCDEGIVSTKAIGVDRTFSIFPNPADDEINVVTGGRFLEDNNWFLVDILSRRVKSGVLENYSETQKIDVSNLPNGIYYFSSNGFSKVLSIQNP